MNRGFVWLLVFMGLTAAKSVYVGHLVQGIDPVLLLLGCFGVVTVMFLGIRLVIDRSAGPLLARCRAMGPDLFWLNVTTAGAWVGYYLALWYGVEPALYGAIANGSQPIATLGILAATAAAARVTRADVLTSLGVLAGMGWLVYGAASGSSAVGDLPAGRLAAAVGLSLLSGVALAGNTVFITRLRAKGLETTEAMALRFFALLLVAGMMFPPGAWAASPGVTGEILVLALFGVAVPLFCYQRGAELVRDPQLVSLLLATLPVMQLVVQLFDPRLSVSVHSWVGVAVVVGCSVAGIVLRNRAARPAEKGTPARAPARTTAAIRPDHLVLTK